jgi:heme-degrading monooxygenase HmoA
MTAFNIVRFRVKPGHQEQFIAHHRGIKNPGLKGFRGGSLVKTGENTFCLIGEWASFQKIVDARPQR